MSWLEVGPELVCPICGCDLANAIKEAREGTPYTDGEFDGGCPRCGARFAGRAITVAHVENLQVWQKNEGDENA
jgi:uncharacterized C2H2 Zn-finger protein